ncbi:MAG TPA: TetR/AcrR family transcriptional regulator [Solirubrobacteraceae bacterium]|jgi:AcrR family transcriptional regulator|nr:TetR/AcrR family transcriptional regulator [Solirubrobacteraceae bacterium]
MRSDSQPAGQNRDRGETQPTRTFIEAARRAQIVAAAIDTIAEVGYRQASLARIAQRIGISKGVIAYHFGSKEELIREVVGDVLNLAEAYMRPRIAAESGGPAVLRAYIESNLGFMAEHRNHLVAVVEIARNADRADRAEADRPDGAEGVGRSAGRPAQALAGAQVALTQLLARFQAAGELRDDFDPEVTALAIRAAIDAVPRRLAERPQLDLTHHGRELADLFDRATSPPGGGRSRR